MGYFPVRYDSRVLIYDRRGYIRLATGVDGGAISGQSYKHFTLVNYDSSVAISSKLLIFTTLES